MKILVPIKLSYDINQMKYDERTGEPILDAVPMIMGDMDRCAIEAALRLKESLGGTVEFLSIGSRDTHNKMMMDAYAMGCDKGYLIEVDNYKELNAYSVAYLISKFAEKYGPYDIIILGNTSQDTHSSIVPPAVSSLLSYSSVFGIDKINVEDGEYVFEATYEDGIYVFKLRPPMVISVTTEANTPRIPTLKDILRAKRMKYDILKPSDLDVELELARVNISSIKRFATPRRGEMIEVDSDEDVEKAVDRIVELLKEAEII